VLYTLKSYIKFILKSTNEHGVHSPFVYSLLTKCIYKKQYKNTKKHLILKKKQIIPYKIASYFKSNEILVLGNSKNTTSLLSLARPNSSVTSAEKFFETQATEKQFDLVYIDTTNNNINVVSLFEKLLHSAHKNCVFIFEGIYTNTANTRVWQHIVASQDVTVSIDGFYCGLVFLKKGQEKQHFTLRL
jgi:hypothetical protein